MTIYSQAVYSALHVAVHGMSMIPCKLVVQLWFILHSQLAYFARLQPCMSAYVLQSCMSRSILEMLNGMERGRGRILWAMLCAWSAAVVMMRTTSCCVTVRFVHVAALVVTLPHELGDFTAMQLRPFMVDVAQNQGFELAACTQAV